MRRSANLLIPLTLILMYYGIIMGAVLFLADRYAHPELCSWNAHPAWSYVAAPITLLVETGFLAILFLPRYRLSFVLTLCLFHVLVFATAGINFVGSGLILLLCLDWNAPLRQATLV